jgi:polyferredoxin
VFFVAGVYFYLEESAAAAYSLATLGALFLFITFIKADALLPLNKLWMRFGLLLGMIVSPIVMGVIFFGLFTPLSIMMRLFGRDELRLRFKQKASHWIPRESLNAQSDAFKRQF